jgi:phospholipid/cholesterol/gamma-HCH transport system substrate-binding protein
MRIRKEAKIGFTFALVIAVAIWGYNFLKGKNFFTVSRQYYAVFRNVGGLQESSFVSANGYKIGIVSDIRFSHGDVSKIVVEISVDRKFVIPSNSIVEIYSTDFMGSKAINLILGNSPVKAKESDTLACKFDGDISVLVTKKLLPLKDKAEHLMESIDSVMTVLRNTFTPETQKNIRTGIASLEQLITAQRTRVAIILTNLEDISANLKNSNSKVTNTLTNLSNLSDSLSHANIKTTINNANEVIWETNLLMHKLNNNQGSIGKFINQDSVYNSLGQALNNLDSLLIDIKLHPKKYVHFSVFGSSEKKR